jgi:hypothetical protein
MVDPKVEAPLRTMLGHVMRGETDDVLSMAEEIGPEMYESAVALAIAASGYIAVRVSKRWPNEADIHSIARQASRAPATQVTEAEITDYLSRVVLGSGNPLDVFEGSRAAVIPLFATANLLLSYSARYDTQWKFLDAIWNAIDEADQLKDDVLPAATFRFARK